MHLGRQFEDTARAPDIDRDAGVIVVIQVVERDDVVHVVHVVTQFVSGALIDPEPLLDEIGLDERRFFGVRPMAYGLGETGPG